MRSSDISSLTLLLAGVCSFFFTARGQIAPAEGCSGAGPSSCVVTSWGKPEWAMPSDSVPTNSPLVFVLNSESSTCEFGAAPAKAQIEVIGPDGAPVKGGPGEVEAPVGLSPGVPQFEWQPDQPLLPSSKYTLRLQGLAGGQAFELPLTTGAGPHQLSAVPAPQAKLSAELFSEEEVCCQTSDGFSCGPKRSCVPVLSRNRALFELMYELPAVPAGLQAHIKASVERSEGGEPYATDSSLFLGLASAPTKVLVRFAGKQGPFCVRLVQTSDVDGQSLTSEPVCAGGEEIDFSDKPGDCQAISGLLGSCKASAQSMPAHTDKAVETFEKLCSGAAGSGGAGGAAGGASAGATGAGAPAAGAPAAGAPAGATAAGVSPVEPGEEGGCSLAAGSPRWGAWGLGLALAGCLRRRRVAPRGDRG